MFINKGFIHYRQRDSMDCGPTCLQMVAMAYGKQISAEHIREKTYTNKQGTNLLSMAEASEKLGFKPLATQCTFDFFKKAPHLPCIVHWNTNHFVVVYKVTRKYVFVADPGSSLLKYTHAEFRQHWCTNVTKPLEGYALFLEPTLDFQKAKHVNDSQRAGLAILFIQVKRYKYLFLQLILALVVQSMFTLTLPFFAQSIVDIGIRKRDFNFVYLLLICQYVIFLGQMVTELVQGWILLHLGTRINISLATDFITKLLKLPITFFDRKQTGDILQRMQDNSRIEAFTTTTTLATAFSLFNGFVFSVLLIVYNFHVFTVFAIGTTIHFYWISLFMNSRKKVELERFHLTSNEQSKIIELVDGIEAIKLSNAELLMRKSWQHFQQAFVSLKIKSLKLEQYQVLGSNLITHTKDIGITYMVVQAVLSDQMTIGMLIAISYMIGQINIPINNMVSFTFSSQNAKLSLDRLSQIHSLQNEELEINSLSSRDYTDEDILFSQVNFEFPSQAKQILKNINLSIPRNKITAIVGHSGCGKSTLIKLLIRNYNPTSGGIFHGTNNLNNISLKGWRESIGVVTQDGFIFNNTIRMNIAMSKDDQSRLVEVSRAANILEFINDLPQQFETVIGSAGLGLSVGQKQRILIARALYKNPPILILDEPTASLDTRNEFVIMENLRKSFENRTVIIVAHRLSTIKNADQIIVLENGSVAESGTHEVLLLKKGIYFNLVSNQVAV